MKTAKAKVFKVDLECPHCKGLLMNSQQGTLSWSVYEPFDKTAFCEDCGKESKVPSRVPGAKLERWTK